MWHRDSAREQQIVLSLSKLLHFSFLHMNFSNAHQQQSAQTLKQWLTLLEVFAKNSCHKLSSAPVAFAVRHTELINPLMNYHCRDLMHNGFPLKPLWSRLLACGVADAAPELIGKKAQQKRFQPPQTPAHPPAPGQSFCVTGLELSQVKSKGGTSHVQYCKSSSGRSSQ